MSNQSLYMSPKNGMGDQLSDRFRTPRWLVNYLDDQYSFTCDAAASDENHLFKHYYTANNSALDADWSESGGNVFCSPPFARGMKEKFLAKAFEEMQENGVSSVFVIPLDVGNACWLSHIYDKATAITRIIGRVKYLHPETGLQSLVGIETAIIEFRHGEQPVQSAVTIIRDDLIKRWS